MDTPTAIRVALSELFDRHASLTIDATTYQTNPVLAAAADEIMALAGLESGDVTREGIAVYRTHAEIQVWERTPDGKKVIVGNEVRRRRVIIDLPRTSDVEVTALGDRYESYVPGGAA